MLHYNIKIFKSFPNVSRVVGAFTAQAGNILQMAECIDLLIQAGELNYLPALLELCKYKSDKLEYWCEKVRNIDEKL